MTLSQNNINKLKTLKITSFDAHMRNQLREEAMGVNGIGRSIEKRLKNNLSSTSAGHSIKEEAIDGVMRAFHSFLEETKPVSQGGLSKGGRKPLWKLPLEEQLSREELKAVYGNDFGVSSHTTAYTAISLALDAGSKHWSLSYTINLIGKVFACQEFEYIMVEGATSQQDKRLMFKKVTNLHDSATQRTRDYARRADTIWRKAKEKGFSFEKWEKNDGQLQKFMGTILLNAVLRGCNLVEVRREILENDKNKTNHIFLTDETLDRLEEKNEYLDDFKPMLGAMLIEPNDWGLDSIGAYRSPKLAMMTPMIKNMGKDQAKIVDEQMRKGAMDEPLRAINTLQRVPLTINRYTLDAVLWAKDAKVNGQTLHLKLKKFPFLTASFIKPVERLKKHEWDKLSKEEKFERLADVTEVKNLRNEVKANIKNFTTMINEAVELIDEQFYLVHQFDTRGRIYHASDFGHHNADYIRSLFKFANSEPVGDNILFLALQLANSYGNGVDKESLDFRVKWVDDNRDKIYQAGNNFKNSVDYWSEADEPLQFLAAAHEYYSYCNFVGDGGEPTEFESSLPIALDATQSGIQHYAAAMRSEKDGRLVNLYESEKPNDFYSECLYRAVDILQDKIADYSHEYHPYNQYIKEVWDINLERKTILTELGKELQIEIDEYQAQMMDEDIEKEVKKAIKRAFRRTEAYVLFDRNRRMDAYQNLWAWHKQGEYNRGFIKRNCMTYVYSSRKFGFAEQLRTDVMKKLALRVRNPEDPLQRHPFTNPTMKDKGYYDAFAIAEIHEQAIKDVINDVDRGMEFIKSCAVMLAEEDKHFTFVTPLGFPMHQHYQNRRTYKTRVFLFDRETDMSKDIDAYYRRGDGTVDRKKSKNAVCPNIIHSMDATHLMKTVLECKELEVDNLLVVHDSFASTIGSAGIMSYAVRKSFYELYRDYNLFNDLQTQLYQQLTDKDADLPLLPMRGQMDLSEVLKADYAFS